LTAKLNKKILILLSLICLPCSVVAGGLPRDVKAYIKNADICDHLTGEINGDGSEEDKLVISNINKYCELSEQAYLKLRRKYKFNRLIIRRIEAYDFIQEFKNNTH